ncbi:DUF3515 domain-containing protein [Streptomyces candidus]|uniref:DUF3515 domain-containing protein n=1 Tax=Streptomyces candidus TaxID=67283 RepID=A0A7X0HIL1_9ACTN|nr:DUF3515 domain-containing protein [Streptomyces candidus]MBB6438321.1 hypothetical protein [Streptomyces candidus]GHH51991.1 hypothetical protein GCM10018773_51250 [Streptomyces candidus]
MKSSTHRLGRTSAAAALLLSAAVACSPTDGSQAVAVPSPPADIAGYCRALHKELPAKVLEDVARRDTSPESPYTAAWGDPAIVLRCGIDRPAEVADPSLHGAEVNGVGWVVDDRDEDGLRFYSRYREAYVELLVPASYHADAGILVDFAKPVDKSIPKTLDD